MAFDLAQGWYAGLKRELEPAGLKVIVRDPNWSMTAGAQALTDMIGQKPAVIVLHNPDMQTYGALIR
jgi:ABC-type sugar transport system substrate-binding protein